MEASFLKQNVTAILSGILMVYVGIMYMFSFQYTGFSFNYLNSILLSSMLIGGILSLFRVVLDIHELDKKREGNGTMLMQILFTGMVIMMNIFVIYINFK